jgi:hypothetical protein
MSSGFDRELMREYSLSPEHMNGKMTGFTGRGKARLLVARVCGGVVLLFMTAIAVPGQVAAFFMATQAIQFSMSAF